jgi:3-methylcrotonyl-CoA carboxylase alpha subunit
MMRWRAGAVVHEVAVRKSDGGLVQVAVDGRSHELQIDSDGSGGFVLCSGPNRRRFWCVRSGDTLHVSWQGAVYVLTEEREGAVRSTTQADTGLQAPMPGKIIKVTVQAGDVVAKGAELLVVESMKMENALRAPRDGRIKSVACKLGDMVAPGTALVEME